MECQQSQTLIASYLDGELSEAQAAPLRKHLLDCQPCRAGAQGEKNQKRWFSAKVQVSVPKGFAARVARRAFAGDTGESEVELQPAGAGGAFAHRVAFQGSHGQTERSGSEDHLLRFVLQATAAAALLVLVLSIALRSLSLPAGSNLRAADGRNEIGVEQALERLDQLNQSERMNQLEKAAERAHKSTPTAPHSSSGASGDAIQNSGAHRP